MSTPTPNAQRSPHEQGWTSSLPGAKLRRVTQYIKENADKDLTLTALAAVVNMSPYHFARLFRHSTGVPPHRFVVRQRIDHAIALLMSGEPSITRIAQIVGFRTSSHFSTVFRRATGAPPRPRSEPGSSRTSGRPRMEGKMRRHEGEVELDRHPGEADAELPAGGPAGADRDSRLVERLRRQEAGAAEALVTAYGNRVYRLAVRITGNESDAEEVTQDALWTASRKIDTFRGAAAFGSWLYRITANTAYQKLRERRSGRNEVSWEQLLQPFDRNGQDVEPVLDWSEKVKDPAIEAELRATLKSAIDALPGEYRAAFLLRDVEGLTNSEVAATLHVKLTTIKSRVHRARLFLQRRLGQYMTEAAPVAMLRRPSIA